MPTKRLLVAAATFSILSISCGGSQADKAVAVTNPATMDAINSSTQIAASGSNINVTITGGDMNGSYSAVCDGCCSYGIAGDHVFGTQYSENDKGAKELSSVQLIVDSVTGNKSTQQFTLTVSFGKLFSADGNSFNINTREGKTDGSGTLNLEYSGGKATVTIKGTSKEGPSIDLKMSCGKVATMDDPGK